MPKPPPRFRGRWVRLSGKLGCTLLALYLLLRHPIDVDGQSQSVWQAIAERVACLSPAQLLPALLLAVVCKACGIGCAVVRWQQLLAGQHIRLPMRHLVRTFLVGRFVGALLPGTLGLDGYKALDVRRVTGQLAAPVAATAVEKLFGLCGMALVYLVCAPWGYAVLGAQAAPVLALTVPVATLGVAGALGALASPRHMVWLLTAAAQALPQPLARAAGRVASGLGAYRAAWRRLLAALALSFGVHVCTAAVYVCTAYGLRAPNLHVFEVLFASSIQIWVTVLMPLSIAGEGVREAVHALLLGQRLGLSNSIVSAALGFWVAEGVPTLVGGVIWWLAPAASEPPQPPASRRQKAAPGPLA